MQRPALHRRLRISPSEGPAETRLLSDARGAMTLAGTFMAVFLVGMLYTLLGIADSIVLQERLQDAADTEAFEASVTMARASNFVALINTVQTSLTASLMAGNLLVLAAQVCEARGAGCGELAERARAVEEQITPPIHAAMRAATDAATDIVETTPRVAADEAARRLATEHGALVHTAFLVPHRMPFADAGAEPLCALGNLYAWRLAEISLTRNVLESHLGRGAPRVGRALHHCEDVRGGGAVVLDPPDLPVGTEPFQVRVVIVGNTRKILDLGAAARIGPSVLGSPPSTRSTRDWVEERDPDRMLVMAQAEYYPDWGEANRARDSERLTIESESFRMRWRARLRRVRVPTGGPRDPAARRARRDELIHDVLLPACGHACAPLGAELVQATESFH